MCTILLYSSIILYLTALLEMVHLLQNKRVFIREYQAVVKIEIQYANIMLSYYHMVDYF